MGRKADRALRSARDRAKGAKAPTGRTAPASPRRKRGGRKELDHLAEGPVRLYWWNGMEGRNFGDALGRYIVASMTGREVVHTKVGRRMLGAGSILKLARPGDVIWGSGFSRPVRPYGGLDLRALRGPDTRRWMARHGYPDAPEIYGDPALLLPRLLDVSGVPKDRRVGIVPHYVDADRSASQDLRAAGSHMIDVLAPALDVVREIVRCDLVYSSSLHGIVVAEAFGIPAVWVEFSDDVVGAGWKFSDYYRAGGREPPTPLDWRAEADAHPDRDAPRITMPDLDALWDAFPARVARVVPKTVL